MRVETRKCSKCGIKKSLSEFYPDRTLARGVTSYCKPCSRLIAKIRAQTYAKTDSYRAYRRAWYARHKERLNVRDRVDYHANPSKYRARTRKWRQENPGVQSIYGVRRRAAARAAEPAWAINFFIDEAYRLAVLRTKMTGIQWVVDHIVPLQSKLVCGLHSHTNIRVIPKVLNDSKGNRYWPDMP